MNQHFGAAVGQVAGRDIVNCVKHQTPLTERSTEWLVARRDHCRGKLKAAQRVLLSDIAFPLMAVGLIGAVGLGYLGITRQLPGSLAWLMPLWVVGTVAFPVFRLEVRRRREATLIKHYQRELDAIEVVLDDRS